MEVEAQLPPKTLKFIKRSSRSSERYASSECSSIEINFASDASAEMSSNEPKWAQKSLNEPK